MQLIECVPNISEGKNTGFGFVILVPNIGLTGRECIIDRFAAKHTVVLTNERCRFGNGFLVTFLCRFLFVGPQYAGGQ